ncbi:MAG TPA: hypothetical protein VFI02_03715 [Armatimonadota bacterium]|nr:hypothetical protein [Armatimonadota bacterium]
MPYARKGKCVYNTETGSKKGCSKTVAGAKKYLAVLNMREHGVAPKKPTKKRMWKP